MKSQTESPRSLHPAVLRHLGPVVRSRERTLKHFRFQFFTRDPFANFCRQPTLKGMRKLLINGFFDGTAPIGRNVLQSIRTDVLEPATNLLARAHGRAKSGYPPG